MKKKVTLFLVLILALSVCNVFASASYSPSIQTNAAASFTIPRADYLKSNAGGVLPAVRTSANGCADVMAANFRINNLEIGAGASFMYNTRSLVADNNFLRKYCGIGVTLGTQYHFDGIMSLGGKLRYIFCSFRPYKNRFDVIEAEIIPAFDLVESKHYDFSLSVPVTASIKSDAVTVRVGVGLGFTYNLVFGGKHAEK